MKKSILTLLIMASMAQMSFAQENTQLEMKVGDTIVWQPFAEPSNIGYSFTNRNLINYKPLGFGEKMQIITKREGRASVIAIQGEKKSTIDLIIKTHEVVAPVIVIEKPETQVFTSTYRFNPPADNFFITITDTERKFNETYMKHGDEEAFNDGQGIDRFWNVKTGENWYYRPEAQGWTDDVEWEFEAFGKSFFPLNSFANEVNKDDLSNYYVGMERILDVNCWHFFVEQEDGSVIQYWVDPSNGCTLKRQVNNEAARVVTVYDLNYTKVYFGPSFKKGLHDTRR